jgi:hypothetical protein
MRAAPFLPETGVPSMLRRCFAVKRYSTASPPARAPADKDEADNNFHLPLAQNLKSQVTNHKQCPNQRMSE